MANVIDNIMLVSFWKFIFVIIRSASCNLHYPLPRLSNPLDYKISDAKIRCTIFSPVLFVSSDSIHLWIFKTDSRFKNLEPRKNLHVNFWDELIKFYWTLIHSLNTDERTGLAFFFHLNIFEASEYSPTFHLNDVF